jgi:voltage-gated potassium channel
MAPASPDRSRWRFRLHEIVFEADTPAGRAFDVVLLVSILASILTVALDSVADIHALHGDALYVAEWFFTILFSIEYVVRLLCVGRPLRYAASFFGIVDLLAILPTYVSLLVGGAQSLIVIRALRLLRVFRILKLAHFVGEAAFLVTAMRASMRKIIVFLGAVVTLVLIIGAAMYVIEGEENGFSSIPLAVYWAVVTLTTVGYGDIAPQTVPGRVLASLVMILGYGIIAVPTGIVSAEMMGAAANPVSTQACPECAAEGHAVDARCCKRCGALLNP